MHTYPGATLAAAGTVVLMLALLRVAQRLCVPNVARWRDLSLRQIMVGAALGAWSHVVLDSVMHADIRPLAPFSQNNGLLDLVSLATLHAACVGAGVAGLIVIAVRDRFASGNDAR